ncbi:hypothetical protein BJ912DRAFT_650484 [Pholiota molesta]|nr:hypothetical protein BJ912DRAFT_650484 [Pholiota molesta]
MDKLPTELHAYICQTACVDDGATIRSLNRVSKYFHEVSRPYLYHTVSAFGIDQVLTLLERLERTPAQMRCIRHLFLSDTASSEPTPTAPTAPAPPSSPPPRLTDTQTQAVARLLALAAPTATSLALVAHAPLSSTALIARVFRTPFPALRRLAVAGFYPFPSAAGRFPALRELRLSGHRNPHGLLQMGALEDAFPGLETLAIAGLGAAGGFVIELEEALAGREGADGLGAFAVPTNLPRTLREITLQAAPEPVAVVPADAEYPDTVVMKDRILVARLDALRARTAKAEAEGVRVTVLERGVTQISPDDVRREWIADIARGDC